MKLPLTGVGPHDVAPLFRCRSRLRKWALPRAHAKPMFRQNCRVEESRDENCFIAATKKLQQIACTAFGACYIPPRTIQPSLSIRQECMHRCHAPLRTAHE